MNKPDYAAFDTELLAQIKAGRNRMMSLDGYEPLQEMAKPFAATSKSPFGIPEWRVIDRRLQALRKAGKISFDRSNQVWSVIEQ